VELLERLVVPLEMESRLDDRTSVISLVDERIRADAQPEERVRETYEMATSTFGGFSVQTISTPSAETGGWHVMQHQPGEMSFDQNLDPPQAPQTFPSGGRKRPSAHDVGSNPSVSRGSVGVAGRLEVSDRNNRLLAPRRSFTRHQASISSSIYRWYNTEIAPAI
jgi:hypothetical protein